MESRLQNIDKICALYDNSNNAQKIQYVLTNIVKKYYKKLKGYKYCKSIDNIKKGFYVKYIDYDGNKIRHGVCVQIIECNKSHILLLKSLFNGVYWKINPYSFFVFAKQCKKKQEKIMDNIINNYTSSPN